MVRQYYEKVTSSNNNVSRKLNTQGGQAVLVSVILILAIGMGLMRRGIGATLEDAKLARSTEYSKAVLVYAEAGVEDVSYRIRRAKIYDQTEVLNIDGVQATTTVIDNLVDATRLVTSTSSTKNLVRSASSLLARGDEVNFNYGIQAGNGGFSLANSSSVNGNVYVNGSVTGSGNVIRGTVVSASSAGLVDGIHSTSSMYAHTIKDSTVDKDAYYYSPSTLINSTVVGIKYPGSIDKPTTSFPISDAKLDEWKTDAEAGGTITSPCPYTITASTTIGPKKINCSLEISGGARVTFSGMVWVVGDISFKNNAGIYLHPTLGAKSVALIADNPSNRSTASKIGISNSTTFYNSGTKGSFLFLVSGNNSAELGGSNIAIDLSNTAEGAVVLYSNHGWVDIGNSSRLKSVTGYKINMKNSAVLTYDDGLESSLFDTGPGGSWSTRSWREVQ